MHKNDEQKQDPSNSSALPPYLNITDVLPIAGKNKEQLTAEVIMEPCIRAATTNYYYHATMPHLSLAAMIKCLKEEVQDTENNKHLTRQENTLAAQINTLDALFHSMAQAASQSKHLEIKERYFNLALKAQKQCAKTIQTLAELKQPQPVAYVKQANIAQSMQVNNATLEIEKKNFSQNKLLEKKHEKRLDNRETFTAKLNDSHLAAMAAVHRT